jgi:hypothetical protein
VPLKWWRPGTGLLSAGWAEQHCMQAQAYAGMHRLSCHSAALHGTHNHYSFGRLFVL